MTSFNYTVQSCSTLYIYRPPMTLREGNIFSRVCLSVISVGKGSHVVITHVALKITIQRPLPPAAALPSPVQGKEARTVGKRAIGIQLECFLVVLSSRNIQTSNRFLTNSILLSECEIPNDITV